MILCRFFVLSTWESFPRIIRPPSMPSHFIRSIFPRLLRHRDEEEPVISPVVGQTSDEAKIAGPEDPPPPYTPENQTLDDRKGFVSKPSFEPSNTAQASSTKPDPKPPSYDSKPSPEPSNAARASSTQPYSEPSPSDSIQICPHATSSFERIQRIVRLPNFKDSYKGIDALTPGPGHRDSFAFKQCEPDSSSDLRISKSSFLSEPSHPIRSAFGGISRPEPSLGFPSSISTVRILTCRIF